MRHDTTENDGNKEEENMNKQKNVNDKKKEARMQDR
jgi:hypothetical protein